MTPPRVTGIGGVFFKAREPQGGWAIFKWRDHQDPARPGTTVWSMINYCGVCEANTPSR